MLEQLDDREIRRGLAVGDRGTLQHPPALRLVGMDDLIDQARLAHARFPDQRHHLAMAGASLGEGVLYGRQLLVPADKPRQAPHHPRLKAAAQGARPDQFIDLHRLRQSLDRDGPQRGDAHQALDQPQRVGGDERCAWPRQLFHTCRQMGRLAHRGVIHMQIIADRPHYHLAGVQADAHQHIEPLLAPHLLGVACPRLAAWRGPHSRPVPHGPHGRSAPQTAP